MNQEKLEQEIFAIQDRNQRVETDKAWETSKTRIIFIFILTYIVAAFVMYFIQRGSFLLNAFIPPIGFYLSTQSLPIIKRWWVKNMFSH